MHCLDLLGFARGKPTPVRGGNGGTAPTNCQLSTVNCQLSTVNCQLSTD
ncbi:MAG: hypothetical protein JGK08_06185 [Microcoleus sp. PH2017_04_SCI_O_A]|nr:MULTISPECIES: hypothetical protein [unclassified Microcoleus]MCC3429662.1 hypothetical protein [Microcoleus sp. PH2017_04_SCI_O_A]MCC3509980.1 hypothetical protein [Microcoleus sp. PH2017_17_BER_D_A]MCC3566704.1 hypothetical protein [Microcoleus sp. PH2017_31_RDM_U_A]MCC3620529.1 hypothetical protein [Microcoleus sp. PH2017_36_ELK_O_B]